MDNSTQLRAFIRSQILNGFASSNIFYNLHRHFLGKDFELAPDERYQQPQYPNLYAAPGSTFPPSTPMHNFHPGNGRPFPPAPTPMHNFHPGNGPPFPHVHTPMSNFYGPQREMWMPGPIYGTPQFEVVENQRRCVEKFRKWFVEVEKNNNFQDIPDEFHLAFKILKEEVRKAKRANEARRFAVPSHCQNFSFLSERYAIDAFQVGDKLDSLYVFDVLHGQKRLVWVFLEFRA